MKNLTAIISLALLFVAQNIQAWSGAGHQVIAAEAYRQLSTARKAEVTKIPKSHPDYEKWKASFADSSGTLDLGMFIFMRASTWPDEIRRRKSEYNHPKWHYVDYPLKPPQFPVEPGPDPTDDILYGFGQCEKVLSDTKASATDRAASLSWLIHLVGDVHMPLHCCSLFTGAYPTGDRGGNSFYIKPATKGIALHSFWDGLLGTSGKPQAHLNYAIQIEAEHTSKSLHDLKKARTPKDWSLESRKNGWDEPGVTKVSVSLEPQGRNRAVLAVEDDAREGFRDLTHAFTLFADSAKKTNPEQRGRFNLGEKLVLAVSDEVTIRTTKGGIRFDGEGRHSLRVRQPVGSRIECLLRLTAEECRALEAHVRKLISPEHIATVFNGQRLAPHLALEKFTATLPTEVADQDGLLRRVNRATTVRLYPVLPGETALLYEMGIPVVETDDRWHYDIGQKVPLTLDRENVPPGFLRQVRVAVFNRMHGQLTAEDANSQWAEAAVTSPDCRAEAVASYLGRRFGEKRVSFDPSDPEANKLAVSQGYTVVHGSMMSGGAWKNAKAAGAIQPAGQVTPGPKVWTGEDNPNAIPFEDWIPESKWTDGMRAIAEFAQRVAEKVLSRRIVVKFCATAHHLGGASYGPSSELVFNKFRLGADWFEQGITEDVVRLLIHEFGHEYSPDHLSSEYHEALCRIAAKLFALARRGEL